MSTGSILAAPPAPARSMPGQLSTRAPGHVLVIASAFIAVVALTVLIVFDGWEYYRAPLSTRGYLPAHRLLRPTGTVGLALGVSGAIAMLLTLPYVVRKRWHRLARTGSMKAWLDVHIFFGVVGPLLVTLHTSFKFNGVIAAGYWLMMAVWASGFVGRYLYVRIPKTIRGVELTRSEIELRLETLRAHTLGALPPAARLELEAFHAAVDPGRGHTPRALDLFFGELRARVRLFWLRRQLHGAGVDVALVQEAVTLAAERAAVARRLAHLHRTRRLFELWHVFHRPLVHAMFAIVALHVGIAVYLGYASFWSQTP